MTLKVADRPPLVTWQLEQLEGECALLQGHAADPSCPCETDTEHCVRKHLLTIEALAKETYAMVENEQDKEIMTDLADQARNWRKRVEQLNLESSPADNPPASSPPLIMAPAPPFPSLLRTEQHDGFQTKIYKETAEFHAGSFRTIKPREDVLVVVGCPKDQADWTGEECVCQATGERGCMELHSLNEPIVNPHSNPGQQELGGFTFEKKFCPACDSFQWHIQSERQDWTCLACRVRDLEALEKAPQEEHENNNHPIIPLG